MSVAAIACNWLLEEECSDQLYKKIEMIPEPLATSNDPLPKAIAAAFVGRKSYITKDSTMTPKKILLQLNYASHLLADSLTTSSCKKRDDLIMVSR